MTSFNTSFKKIIPAYQNVFDNGILVASGTLSFEAYTPDLIIFILVSIVPTLIEPVYIYSYVQPKSLLIFNMSYKELMFKKLKKLKYEHFENKDSVEIIDKAYMQTQEATRHMFPMNIHWSISSLIASVGFLWYFVNIRWWFSLTILIPFILQTILESKEHYNV